jgi:hypothetical protein
LIEKAILDNVVFIAAGRYHTVALKRDADDEFMMEKAKIDLDGEIMGISLSVFCLILSLILLPLTLIYMIIFK